MNGCRAKYSSLAAAFVTAASLATVAAVADPTPKPGGSSVATGAISAAEQHPGVMPSFAAIPPAPTDLRPFTAWRAAIADTKAVGARTQAEALAGPWLLNDTEAWAEQGRAAAAPPAPMTTPEQANTAAFVRDMIRRATPPPRASH